MPIDSYYITIPLTKGKETVIESEDFPLIDGPKWQALEYAPGKFYAVRKKYKDGKQLMVYMHRQLFGLEYGDDIKIDHINMDGLDNRRSCNLRLATKSQNMMNTTLRSDNKSGLKNVFYDERKGKWKSYINKDGKRRWLGSFATKEEAHQVYLQVVYEMHGEFARIL
jgi:hypothetical protein